MDISVNLDSFTLLELGKLRYADYFEHHPVYLQSVQRRVNKINSRWHKMAKLLKRPETAIYLHPLMRSLTQTYVRPRRRFKSQRSVSQRLIRRSHKYGVLPSFRPFMCQRCNLSSFSLTIVKRHECRRRKYKPYNVDEIKKGANMGVRSGIRNAMCVLEMADYPNKIRLLPKARSWSIANLEQLLPMQKNQKVPQAFQTSDPQPVEIAESASTEISLPYVNESSLASFCLTCRQSFGQSEDFKQHSARGCKNSKELKFLVRNCLSRTGIEFLPSASVDSFIRMLCLSCSRSDFLDSTDFHRHIMYCS